MQTKICPECGDDIPLRSSRHAKCGWQDQPEPSRTQSSAKPADNRCAYVSAIGRCRFVGTIGHGMPTPGHDYPPLYCRNHFDVEPPLGDADCERSCKQMPAGFDYSTPTLVKAAKERFKSREGLQ